MENGPRKWVEMSGRKCCKGAAFSKVCSQVAGWSWGGWGLQKAAPGAFRLRERPVTPEDGLDQSCPVTDKFSLMESG